VVVLRGRDAESELLASCIDALALGESAALIVRGEHGSGRSALLDDVARYAQPSASVLRLNGVPAESSLPFAAVHQLLRPLARWSGGLPDPQAAAIQTVLGLDGAAFDVYRISLGVLTLLSRISRERPALVLVDDADQLDRQSAGTLAFVTRRLACEPVAVVIATLNEDEIPEARDDWTGLPEITLSPLTADDAALLVTDKYPDMARPVLDRVVAEAAGNPLVLMELCRALPPDVFAGDAAMPPYLAPKGRMGRALAARIEWLAPESQQILLLIAADTTGVLSVVLRAARALGLDESALSSLIAARVVVVEQGEVRFNPPVMRAVSYNASPLPMRLRAHQALAEALAHDRAHQVWHQAECALDVDETLAGDVARIAARYRQAGDAASAADLLQRAAVLTAIPARRAGHLVEAAECAWQADARQRAGILLDSAALIAESDEHVARIARLRALREQHAGSLARAYQILLEGAEPILASHPDLADQMLATAQSTAWLRDDQAGLSKAADMRAGLLAAAPESHGELTGRLCPNSLSGAGPQGRVAESGATSFMTGLPRLITDIEAGHWGRAEREIGTVMSSPRHGDQPDNPTCLCYALLAWVCAMRGQAERCLHYASATLEAASSRQLSLAMTLAQWAAGLLALGEGRIDDAVRQLRDVVSGGVPARHAAVAAAAASDLLEALVRAGDYPDAWQLLDQFDNGLSPLRDRMDRGLVLRCRALVAGPDSGRLFAEALCRPGLPPFEVARTQLVYGEWLRRNRKVKAARVQLHAALDCFKLLGAEPWSARCRTELRAAGLRAGEREAEVRLGLAQLTSRELQIIRSVAAGKTNRQVAAELFISPRTVSDHLYKLFPKIGISSRHELRRFHLDLNDHAAVRAHDLGDAARR
jgi:DNA-binding CsgD family transcriptional regulator/Asp-tRNA(Asn)/Glu-tRNA(Gln) amidotransferase C subunit